MIGFRWAAEGRGAGLLLLAVGLWTLPAPGSGQLPDGEDLPVREVALDNGMTVLVLPRRGAPTVSLVVQYGVGGVHERLGSTGAGHLLEHLLFKGTTTVGTRDSDAERRLFRRMDAAHDTLLRVRGGPTPESARANRLDSRIRALEDSARAYVVPNEFDRILSRNGARGPNATTDHESTTYYVELPANRLELWFVLEADRMANPVFREFYTERDVVLEERRTRVTTDPAGSLREAFLAAAFRVHPYGVPVVGWESDLRTLSRRRVRAHHARHYGPENTVVAVVGDVESSVVEDLAHRYFGSLPGKGLPPPVLVREPPQRGERRVEVLFDAEPLLSVGWHVGSVFHDDAPALTVLTSLLTGGKTSRLHQSLVLEERLASQVTSAVGPGQRFPRLLQIHAVPRSPHTAREVEEAVYRELDHLRAEPPSRQEIQRVRNQLEAARVRRLESNLGLAFRLAGSASLTGDWRTGFRLARRLGEVGPADVQRVVRRYVRRENRTVAMLVRDTASSRAGPGAP